MRSILFSLFLFTALLAACRQKEKEKKLDVPNHPGISFKNDEIEKIESGDILIKRGNGPISNLIVSKLAENVPLSHCGVVVKTKDSVYVVHSVTESYGSKSGVQNVSFNNFIKDSRAHYFYVVRLKQPKETRDHFSGNIQSFTRLNIPFDQQIQDDDRKAMSCSEMIKWGIIDAGLPNPFKYKNYLNHKIPLLNSLLDTNYFEIIIKK